MAFRFIPSRGAVDDERQVVVAASSQFYDDLIDRLHYTYIHGDMTLEFVAVTDDECVPGAEALPGSTYVPSWTTASHIDDLALRRSFAASVNTNAFDELLYVDIRDSVRKGLFVLVTEGGAYRGVSPDFLVDFDGSS